jgi:hypothetical protein
MARPWRVVLCSSSVHLRHQRQCARVHGNVDIEAEAKALLGLAALREDIPVKRARAFAEAVLAESELGRNALAVLKGEPHAVRALVELALDRWRRSRRSEAHDVLKYGTRRRQ